ncbi:hypothetical protein SDC9_131658 [bioreactor metagenome]|uniref:Uncharacterized protein n=1 Tax=bioreactor metagenome TaxID=1076179 RepID=A0A645D5U7_9ZZZZ
MEFYQSVSALHFFYDLRRQLSPAEGHLRAGTQLFPRADKTLPNAVSPVRQQQHLAGPAAGHALPQKAGGQNPGIV